MIRGDSATGKTTLIDMIQDHANNPSGSPVEVVCDKPCYVLAGALWREQLSGMRDGIVFIDEGNEFIKTDEFSREIQKTDNYYVIATRESLPSLPYSVEEIYGIRESRKYGTLKQRYHEFYVFQRIKTTQENALVIADGAAFGSEIDRVLRLLEVRKNVMLYLPESFEWLILLSGILKDNHVVEILENPSAYIESQTYFSWERYFTSLLAEKTNGTYLAYTKRKLNDAYLNEKVKRAILDTMENVKI